MNKVILMGRLARDPDVRTTQGGRQVARMTIAVDRRISRAKAQAGQQTADFVEQIGDRLLVAGEVPEQRALEQAVE